MRIIHLPFLLASLLLLTAARPVAAETTASQMAQAIAAQRKLADASPNDASLWNDLGNLLWTNHQEKDAAIAYEHALSVDPASAAPHYNLGLLLTEQGKLREALKQFHAVLQSEPKSAWAHFQIGAVYQLQGLPDKAVEEYASAFRIDPNLSFADVNPQVVANPLITEAVMRAFENTPGTTLAPRSYSNPGHIAGLFLPPAPSAPPKTTSTASPKSGTAETTTIETPKSGTAEIPARLGPAQETSPEQQAPTSVGARVRELTPESLHSGEQGTTQKSSASREGGTIRQPIIVPEVVVPGSLARPAANGKTRVPNRPQGTAQPQSPTRSVPANPSTGRLDLHLVDDPAPAG